VKVEHKPDSITVPLKRHADKNRGHHHIIYDSVDDKYVSVGTTSQPKKGKNSPNYNTHCDVLGNGKNTYLRRQGTVDNINNYFGSYSGKITSEAYEQGKKYAEKAKAKYLSKKRKKVTNVPNT